MAGFGENLRREREMRGISLQEISDTTKVSVRFLEALEEEDFSKLPGGIFIRSFIRAYANYLGLDEERVIAEYQLVAPTRGEENFSRLGVTGTTTSRHPRAPILPWIVAVVLLGAGYAIFKYSHRSPEAPVSFGNPPPSSQAASMKAHAALNVSASAPPQVLASAGSNLPSQTSSAANTPGLPQAGGTVSSKSAAKNPVPGESVANPVSLSGAASAKPVGSEAGVDASAAGSVASGSLPTTASAGTHMSATSNPAFPAKTGGLVLQVAATERAWISVKADGKTVLQRVLSPNDVRTLTAKHSFDVTTGNAQGTVLTLNGVTLKPLGRYGEVKMAHLTRSDLKSLNP